MASHAPQMCPVIWGKDLRRDLRRASNGLTRASNVSSYITLPKQGTASDGGQKNPSGQIVPIIGNSLIQTVANSSTIWRGAVVGTFPISLGLQHIPRGTPSVSEVRHLASQKDGRVFEVRPGLKFYKPSLGPTLSRRRV